ncbi:MAG: tRNA pseudouridine(38-40) synthase TruA [Ruminiclostridium sp.]|nr:tRNA pseudouridine(38-40) synthase TruA [Ruminiclostridium sp.]
MRNLKITISYNGTAYHGWQRQPNNITVQEVVESALHRVLGEPAAANGCSRTDAGVHARQFVFTTNINNPVPCPGLAKALNGLLPRDIAVLGCEEVPPDFHARFSAKGKEYVYVVDTSPTRNVFSADLALHYPHPLDENRLNSTAELFVGKHDFAAFCKAEAKEHLATTVRTVRSFTVTRENNMVLFTVSGDGFLHNMVRIMVGTLIYVNENKRTEDDILRSLSTGERSSAGVTIPPHGLYLNKVFY